MSAHRWALLNLQAPVAAEFELPEASIHSALGALTDRMAALSAESTDDMTKRLKAVLELAEKAKAAGTTPSAPAARPAGDGDGEGGSAVPDQVAQAEYAEKVKELYEITKKWDAVATVIPDLMSRLTTLKALHEQGSDFGRTLTQLEVRRSWLTAGLSVHFNKKSGTDLLPSAEWRLDVRCSRRAGVEGRLICRLCAQSVGGTTNPQNQRRGGDKDVEANGGQPCRKCQDDRSKL